LQIEKDKYNMTNKQFESKWGKYSSVEFQKTYMMNT